MLYNYVDFVPFDCLSDHNIILNLHIKPIGIIINLNWLLPAVRPTGLIFTFRLYKSLSRGTSSVAAPDGTSRSILSSIYVMKTSP